MMIKFKVNENLLSDIDRKMYGDIIYTILDETSPEIEIRWIEPDTGEEEKVNYSNAEMQKYFKNREWIKVEQNYIQNNSQYSTYIMGARNKHP